MPNIRMCPTCYEPVIIIRIELSDKGAKIRTYACEATDCGWVGQMPFTGW